MKVLWLINILLPPQSRRIGQPQLPVAGWVTGLLDSLRMQPDLSLLIMSVSGEVRESLFFEEKGVEYLVVPKGQKLDACFKEQLILHQPDLIHIFGTEYPHSCAMMRVSDPWRTLVQIQGFMTGCSRVFYGGLNGCFRHPNPIKALLVKLVGGTNSYLEYRRFVRASAPEQTMLAGCHHVLGHTQWDAAIAQQYAPNADYHSFNETLRADFYEGEWSIARCKPYSIFVSQAMYPIKGFHMLLQALPELVQAYPGTHVYVAGSYPQFHGRSLPIFVLRLLSDYYGYIRRRIRTLGLENHITFLGALSEAEMKRQYLSSNVFVSCSSIENESNSLSEAKMLGVPCVASYVGGVTERITHGESGFFYPFNEVDMLRYYVGRIFEDPELARRLSAGARREARITNDPVTNASAVIEIYREVLHGEEVM